MANFIAELKAINPQVKVAYHSDGMITPIIPELIEIGVDVLNPIQPASMDPAAAQTRIRRQALLLGIHRRATYPALRNARRGSPGGQGKAQNDWKERRPDPGPHSSRATGHAHGKLLGHAENHHRNDLCEFKRLASSASEHQRGDRAAGEIMRKAPYLLGLLLIIFLIGTHSAGGVSSGPLQVASPDGTVQIAFRLDCPTGPHLQRDVSRQVGCGGFPAVSRIPPGRHVGTPARKSPVCAVTRTTKPIPLWPASRARRATTTTR